MDAVPVQKTSLRQTVKLSWPLPTCMDLEENYDKVDRKNQWNILRIFEVGGHLLEGIRAFHENASASVHVNGELSESFSLVRQECVMSP